MQQTSQMLLDYGWIAICVVLGGVCVYLYKQSRKDKEELTQLYEKWIASNAATNGRIDKLLDDYRKLILKMAGVMQKAMDRFGIEEEKDDD